MKQLKNTGESGRNNWLSHTFFFSKALPFAPDYCGHVVTLVCNPITQHKTVAAMNRSHFISQGWKTPLARAGEKMPAVVDREDPQVILAGVLKPGDRLRETSLAKHSEMRQSPIGFLLSRIAMAESPVLSAALLITGTILSVYAIVQSHFDSNSVVFLNQFVGKSGLLDQWVGLISDTFILNSALFVALLWFIWFKDKREEFRIRLFMGGVAAVLAGVLSRLLQLSLPFHVRPLYNTDLKLTWPIGIEWGTLNHWSSFPSDHASLCFAFATLIWRSDRRLGVFAFFWAAITSSTRIYLGFHYPSDILGGAVLGILMVILFQKLPSPRVVYRLLDWERYASSSFYAVAFIASYQAGTLFNDVRTISQLLLHLLLRHPV